MRRFMLAHVALVSTGCAGLLGLDDFTDGEAASASGGGSTGTTDVGGTTSSQGGAGSTTTTTTGTAGGSGDGGSGPGQGGGGGGETDPLAVTPEGTVKVGILHARQFEANVEVEWSIEEEDGGTIDETGFYVAPAKAGSFHLTATSVANPAESVEVTITAAPLGIKLLGGIPGGPGTIDGPPAKSRVSRVAGMAVVDNGQSVAFSDRDASTIRIFDTNDSVVETVAGVPFENGWTDGTGEDARFDAPTTVAAERDSDVAYVIDGDGSCVRRVNTANNAVTTLAGECGSAAHVDALTGAAVRFDRLESIAIGPNGGLWGCEGAGYLRKISTSTGATSSVSGGGLPSISYGCRLAPNYYNWLYLYPGRYDQPTIVQFEDTTPFNAATVQGVVTLPSALDFDAFASDTGFGELDLFGTDGEVMWRFDLDTADPFEVFMGAAGEVAYRDGDLQDARLTSSSAITAWGGQGKLYFADDASTIRELDRNEDVVRTIVGKPANEDPIDGPKAVARMPYPFAVSLDDDGNIYSFGLGEGEDNVIRRTDPVTGEISLFSGVRGLGDGSEIVDGAFDEAKFGFVLDLVTVGDFLYALDVFSHTIRRVSLDDGSVTTIAGQTLVQGFQDGIGEGALLDFSEFGSMTTDGTDLYIVEGINHSVRKIILATNEVVTIAGGTEGTENGTGVAAQFLMPIGVTFDGGFLYIADGEDHVIRRMELESEDVTTLIGLSGTPGQDDGSAATATLQTPFRMAADGLGNLFLSSGLVDNTLQPTIRRIDLDAVEISPFAGRPGARGFAVGPLPASVGCPASMIVDAAGDLLFADFCDGVIGAIRTL